MVEKTNKKGVEELRPATKLAEYECKCGNEIAVVFIRCKVIKTVECDKCGKRARLIASE